MKIKIAFALATALLSISCFAESRKSYDPILQLSVIKKQIEMDGETYVRCYFRPKNPETKLQNVIISIQRDGETLKTIKHTARTINEESLSKEYPWEALLPIGKEYEGAEFVHNLESGALQFTLSANIKGKGLKVKEINND